MPSSVADSVFPWRTANSTLVDPKRRAKAKSSNVGEDADTPVDSMMICDDPNNNTNVTVNCKAKCSFHWLAPSTERLISCATVLVGVSMFRTSCGTFIRHVLKRQLSPNFHFPAWEGPVLLAGMCRCCCCLCVCVCARARVCAACIRAVRVSAHVCVSVGALNLIATPPTTLCPEPFPRSLPPSLFLPPLPLATEYMAICDAIFSAAASACTWHLAIAILLLILCPLALIFVPLAYLRSHVAREKQNVFSHRSRECTLTDFAKTVRNSPGVSAKFKHAYLYLEQWEAKGDW